MMMAAAITLALATPVAAKSGLSHEQEIDNGLLVVGIAHLIREACPDISPRLVRAYTYLRGLESKARALGYSEDEIRAHMESDTEKARMRQRGDAYFAERGASADDADSLCQLGREEIAADSAIGRLLRVSR
jgi:hypothetical protein